MADSNSRIEQFQKMASDDPNNEVAHFSLGREYLTAGQLEAAVESLGRCLTLNPNISKAYQLQADALLKLNRKDEAIARLTEGVNRADERGDMMPRAEMIKTLSELGAPVPELKAASTANVAVGEGQVRCARCHQVKSRLSKPPFKGPHAKEIYEQVCADCWREWIPMGTKVINELRLPMDDPKAQKIYDQHMVEFLNIG